MKIILQVFLHFLQKNHILKSYTVIILSVLTVLGIVTDTSLEVYASEGINVDYHTEDEIRSYADSHNFYDTVTYAQEPVLSPPYFSGALSDETLQGALEMLNFARYIAGIPANVELDGEYTKKAQTGCLVNAVNGVLSHQPDKPSDMSDDLFQLGYSGTSSSNLGWGYSSLVTAIKDGWLEDGDSSNIDRVGHRRWVLNPSMRKTGFGKVNSYVSMYAFDKGNNSDKYGVAWPAQVMPTELFGSYYPWSISMGYEVDYNSVNVKLIHNNTGNVWNFSSNHADGDFYVDNQGYGQSGCIIFRPNNISGYNNGDTFRVEITGLKNKISYDVTFFNLYPQSNMYDDYLYYDIYDDEYAELWNRLYEYYDDTYGDDLEYDTEQEQVIEETAEEDTVIQEETTIEETTTEPTALEETAKETTDKPKETERKTRKAKETETIIETESADLKTTGKSQTGNKGLKMVVAGTVAILAAGGAIITRYVVYRRKQEILNQDENDLSDDEDNK